MTNDVPILRARSDAWGPTTRELLHQTLRGRLVRVSHGRYVDAATWERLDDLDRHRVRTLAVASAASTDNVFSHHAAAALWRIPLLGGWPDRIDVLGDRATGGRSSEQIRRRVADPGTAISLIGGVRVTTPAQTVADLARILPRVEAIAAIDSACWRGRDGSRAALDDVHRIIERRADGRGGRRALDALSSSTDRAESVWETASRLAIEELGFPPPTLQHEFEWSTSLTYRVDFWWPNERVIGEFDGLVKYSSAVAGEARDILVREKVREDRLRTMSAGFVRWTAVGVRDPARLSRLLSAAGLSRSSTRFAYASPFRG